MRRFCAAFAMLILTGGCKPGAPDGVLDPDRMQLVLFDIHVVDGYITSIPNQDSAKKVSAAFYKGVYKKFGIDSATYNNSMNYYYDHPDQLVKIYEALAPRFKKTKDSLDKIQIKVAKKEAAARKFTQDSLEKANPGLKLKREAFKRDSTAKANLELKLKIRVTKDSMEKVNRAFQKKAASAKKVNKK